jgi:hypothetical protein
VILRESRTLVAAAIAVAAAVHIFAGALPALPFWAITLTLVWLFRDPPRHWNGRPLSLVSPVDGAVVAVAALTDPYLMQPGHAVVLRGGWLGPYLLRSPIEGRVETAWSEWRDPQTAARRAGHAVSIRTDEGDEVVLAFASRLPWPLMLRTSQGERIGHGHVFGLLPFGGLAAVMFAGHGRVLVAPGQRVAAGLDPVATLLHD